jgi:hypothetical protein
MVDEQTQPAYLRKISYVVPAALGLVGRLHRQDG